MKNVLRVPLPAGWEYSWHKLSGVYDGKEMAVYIDGNKTGALAATGNITNFPFPVNVGRNEEIHGQETDVHICDALIDNAGIFTKPVLPGDERPEESVLWLNFEKESDEGVFFSYGIGARTYGSIWPDRRVQPEMWQMKKTVQPVSVSLVDAETGWVEVWNRNHFTDAAVYRTRWTLESDGDVIEEGEINLEVPPLTKKRIRIPYHKPEIVAGKEYRITISLTLKNDEIWASAGHEVAWEQLELPWYKPAETPAKPEGTLRLNETADNITVSGADFTYVFDKSNGALASIVLNDREMLKSPLVLNTWRAPLANETDSWNARTAKEGYGQQLATDYYLAGLNNLTSCPMSIEAYEHAGKVHINIREITLMGNGAVDVRDKYIRGQLISGFENLYACTVEADGEITLHHTIIPQGQMPAWLPRIGLTLTLDKRLDRVEWYGRGPQENYPDRKTGYKLGVYSTAVKDMYEPYLMPQDYGLRTDTRWIRMTGETGKGLEFSMDQRFNFNAYPFSTDNLTKAVYTYQLQEQDGITLNLDYATSGTGCTARGIFSAYRAIPQLYEREITIRLIRD